ncbi:outer-membrane lipoprotein LolB precursor [Janthinobacterium sp. HH104]|uniref:outer membrane lipoprotein LolB n=1 Tax=Janthinobacterium sp. HH104 TaxID=1537276 RepID=UPI000873D171|nr:outer membrane lipoprotein LolB [Janthinobacterium sp. HH104]OEZ77792.1 outer-membrane lipoprotein LolB precursor [Janthinobacterium sp. HH104]
MSKNLFALTALCLSLSACSTLSSPFASSVAPSGQSVAPYREQVELTGRLNVVYQKDDKPESATVNFNWQQTAQRTDVTLYSPVGSTLATIAVTPQQAVLTQSGKAPRSAPDVDALSAQMLGWSLPVSGLRDWLQGHAVGADGKRFVASPANDSVTTKDGWRLRYVSWQDASDNTPGALPQPRRIDAERNASAQADAVSLRIVLDAPSAQAQ